MTVILGGVLLAAGVVLFILEPIFSGHRAPLYDGDDVYDDAAAKRRIALTALRDLEYDRATGKVDGEDYERLRAELSREALKHLEAKAAQAPEAGASGADGAAELGVEMGLEAEIARIRAALREGMACPACDTVNREGSSFCSRCGKALTSQEAAGATG